MTPADIHDADRLAAVAAATCPPDLAASDIHALVGQALSADRFASYLADEAYTVLKATEGAAIVGYAVLVANDPTNPEVARAVTALPTLEVNKLYVRPEHHGAASALLTAALAHARDRGRAGAWLGVSRRNERAQRFYRKHGFDVVGTRTFQVGTRICDDYVMQAELS